MKSNLIVVFFLITLICTYKMAYNENNCEQKIFTTLKEIDDRLYEDVKYSQAQADFDRTIAEKELQGCLRRERNIILRFLPF
ncbi:hypothetical protein DLAC_04381 [Tieghemostelium lacteum]|uniref:Uncharacterized protein n=1 Tax=Tieghemostelium lacteum TaxID=361077 RepID=A0A151ZJP0_TIELA|nr:hypothetical protein DLAC_04381 [Tieghemostelium lacteum]|eukprot:KYQ94100.1 hypothetical protein DLAC_04381 [Tieghemostelium lacteum]